MNKTELITSMSEKSGLSKKDTEKALTAFTAVVGDALVAADKVAIVGFGTFETVERAARTCRNPKTGEPVDVQASKAPKFRAAKALKDAVNA